MDATQTPQPSSTPTKKFPFNIFSWLKLPLSNESDGKGQLSFRPVPAVTPDIINHVATIAPRQTLSESEKSTLITKVPNRRSNFTREALESYIKRGSVRVKCLSILPYATSNDELVLLRTTEVGVLSHFSTPMMGEYSDYMRGCRGKLVIAQVGPKDGMPTTILAEEDIPAMCSTSGALCRGGQYIVIHHNNLDAFNPREAAEENKGRQPYLFIHEVMPQYSGMPERHKIHVPELAHSQLQHIGFDEKDPNRVKLTISSGDRGQKDIFVDIGESIGRV